MPNVPWDIYSHGTSEVRGGEEERLEPEPLGGLHCSEGSKGRRSLLRAAPRGEGHSSPEQQPVCSPYGE